jgi:hypothetical protein
MGGEMRIEIQLPSSVKSSEQCNLRALLFNDSYEPVAVSRNAFVGPNVRALHPAGFPLPESVEPTVGAPDEPLTLQPFTFYGRERSYGGLQPGEIDVTAYYRPEGGEEIAATEKLHVEQG